MIRPYLIDREFLGRCLCIRTNSDWYEFVVSCECSRPCRRDGGKPVKITGTWPPGRGPGTRLCCSWFCLTQ